MSEKKKASNAKWDAANLKRLSLALPIDLFSKMQEHTSQTGETQNGFIKRAISETISRERYEEFQEDDVLIAAITKEAPLVPLDDLDSE